MARRRREFIFEAVIDYRQGRLTAEENRVEPIVTQALLVDLPRELDRIFGVRADIQIKATRYGSLSVFFGAVLAGYSILSGYKGIYDSVELIRQQADTLLEAALGRFAPDRFATTVHLRYPQLDERRRYWSRLLNRGLPPELLDLEPLIEDVRPPRRDGFFVFLLVLSIAELLVIGLLVYGAVVKTYF